MTKFDLIASGLRFPEGPVAMPDGSVVLVEIERQTLTRVTPDGKVSVIAKTGGGPNGAAIGPDGKCYICNNGGFTWADDGKSLRASGMPDDYSGGRIERVDLATGALDRVCDSANGRGLRGPNDIVFDRTGGFWFTDLGKFDAQRRDHGALYYGRPDGTCRRVAAPMVTPNGVGLSPDERTLYVAESVTARLWAFDIEEPGIIRRSDPATPHGGRMLWASPTFRALDSLAVDGDGNVCIASFLVGGIVVLAPDGRLVSVVETDDIHTTNICFGGADLRTAYITLGGSGRLVAMQWRRPGLKLNFLNK